MTKEQILEALAPLYQAASDERLQLMESYIQASDTDNRKLARALCRDIDNNAGFMGGIAAAAYALGITTVELTLSAITKS